MEESLTQVVQNVLGTGLALSTLVVLAVEVVKSMNIISKRYLPLISILIGISLSQVIGIYLLEGTNLVEFALAGFVSGVVASGLYDSIKNKRNDPTIE